MDESLNANDSVNTKSSNVVEEILNVNDSKSSEVMEESVNANNSLNTKSSVDNVAVSDKTIINNQDYSSEDLKNKNSSNLLQDILGVSATQSYPGDFFLDYYLY